ncbi:MAG TPA: hypothetical protein PKY20_07190, partial [Methanothrix sp.]|nr:hypothetical protein [Methanothrix sp.]
ERRKRINRSRCFDLARISKRAISKRRRDQKPLSEARMGKFMQRGRWGEQPGMIFKASKEILPREDRMRGRVILINWDRNMIGQQDYFEVL